MKKCFECEAIKDLQEHHVVPRSRGGTKTVTLCHSCHLRAHGRDSKGLNHKRLVKEGLERAKAAGMKLGNPNWETSISQARQAKAQKTSSRDQKYLTMISMIKSSGITSYRGIARRMNELSMKSPTGKSISPTFVRNLLLRQKTFEPEEK